MKTKVSLYLSACEAEGMARDTIRDKKRHLDYFEFDLDTIGLCDIYARLNELKSNNLIRTPIVEWKAKRDLRSFLRFCNENGYCKLPYSVVKNKKPEENIRPCATYDEYMLLRCNMSPKYQQLLDFMWQTGVRAWEIASIEKKNLDYNGEINDVEFIGAKTRKKRTAYFVCDLSHWIDLDSPLLFPITTKRLRDVFRLARKKCGMKRMITPHTFRHAFITRSLDKGVNVQDVAIYAGHDHIQTTMHYYHRSKLKEKYKKNRLWE